MPVKFPKFSAQGDPDVARLRREIDLALRSLVSVVESREIIAGAGLTGGGNLSGPVTLSATATASPWVQTQYELDFSAESTASVTAPTQSIDGNTWGVNINSTDTLDLTAGSGLQFVAAASSSVFTSSSQTASHIWLDLSDLYTQLSCDPRAHIICEIYASALNLTGTGYISFGLYGPSGTPTGSGSRMSCALIQSSGGNTMFKTMVGTTFGSNYQHNSCDTWGFQNNGTNDIQGLADSSAWGGSWPTDYDVTMNGATNDTFDPLRHPSSRFAIAFATNGTLGTMTATIERIRVTAFQPQM